MTMRLSIACTLALALGGSSAFLVACGGKTNPHLIPAVNASGINHDLDALQSAVSTHDCPSTAAALRQLQADAGSLPTLVDPRLRTRIQDAVVNLDGVASTACTKTTSTASTPTTTAAPTTTPTPTTTTPVTTPTTTPTTTPATTPTTTPTPPANGGTTAPAP